MEKEKEFFNTFVSKYNSNYYGIKWKVEHSYRVADYSKLLAESLNLDESEVNRAYIIGLFHDIGRFPQYTKYHTFDDKKSIDHGILGYQILMDVNYMDDITKDAVLCHNLYEIPEEFNNDPLKKIHCEIIRDADKLDNLANTYKLNIEGMKVNLELIKYFENKELLPNGATKTDLDEYLRELSFVYDINLDESLKIIKNENMIRNKIDYIFEQTKDENIYLIEDLINEYIEERIGAKKNGRIG